MGRAVFFCPGAGVRGAPGGQGHAPREDDGRPSRRVALETQPQIFPLFSPSVAPEGEARRRYGLPARRRRQGRTRARRSPGASRPGPRPGPSPRGRRGPDRGRTKVRPWRSQPGEGGSPTSDRLCTDDRPRSITGACKADLRCGKTATRGRRLRGRAVMVGRAPRPRRKARLNLPWWGYVLAVMLLLEFLRAIAKALLAS